MRKDSISPARQRGKEHEKHNRKMEFDATGNAKIVSPRPDIHAIWITGLYPERFSHTEAWANLRRYAPDARFHLWDRDELEPLANDYEPGLWEELFHLSRPVMAVDILRWLILYRFGGLYWQIGCVPWYPIDAFVPDNPDVACRLWTENVMLPEQCRQMAAKPIRKGIPEEPVRIAIQVLYSRPEAPFALKMLSFLLDRVRALVPREDYDVLYITGNAAMSEAYDRFGKNDPHVELMNLAQTRQMVRWRYHGTWRNDSTRAAAQVASQTSDFPPFRLLPPIGMKERAKSWLYRFVKRHPHENLFRSKGLWEGGGALQALATAKSFLETNGIRCLLAVPFATPADRRFLNLLYDPVPNCDLALLPDVFEWLPYHEIQRILSRLLQSSCRFLAITHCPLLESHANRGLGDFRPLNLEQSPFRFSPPELTIPFPSPHRRQDRVLAVWNCEVLRKSMCE